MHGLNDSKGWHHEVMQDDDDPRPDATSEQKSAVPANDVPELSPDALVIAGDALQVTLVNPLMLIQGLRYLQQRIPGFTQLSVEEERSLIRVASLDPEFIEAGLRAAGAWSEAKAVLGRSGPELRQEDDEIRVWDEAESNFLAVAKGISAANRKRRYHLGRAILLLYKVLGQTIDMESRRHLRPYYEARKRAYQNRKRKRRKAKE